MGKECIARKDVVFFHAQFETKSNKLSDCLNDYNSIKISRFFYVNEHVCVILLIEISKKIQQETETYFLMLWVAVQKNIGFFCFVFDLSSLFLSLSVLDDI